MAADPGRTRRLRSLTLFAMVAVGARRRGPPGCRDGMSCAGSSRIRFGGRLGPPDRGPARPFRTVSAGSAPLLARGAGPASRRFHHPAPSVFTRPSWAPFRPLACDWWWNPPRLIPTTSPTLPNARPARTGFATEGRCRVGLGGTVAPGGSEALAFGMRRECFQIMSSVLRSGRSGPPRWFWLRRC